MSSGNSTTLNSSFLISTQKEPKKERELEQRKIVEYEFVLKKVRVREL
jgi:hypothetical protein